MAPSSKSKTFEAGDLIKLDVGNDNEENMRKFVLPQKHPLIKKYKSRDEAVVMVKNLPYGMVEKNVSNYFNQFGSVVKCRVPHYPENGRSKGVAYIHFKEYDVARVACSTMHNYFILGNLLKCKLIPGRHVKKEFFAKSDNGYHERANQRIKKMNSKKRTSYKEGKLLRKRTKSALMTLNELNASDISPKDLGVDLSALSTTKPKAQKVQAKSPGKKTSTKKSSKATPVKSPKQLKKTRALKTPTSKPATESQSPKLVKKKISKSSATHKKIAEPVTSKRATRNDKPKVVKAKKSPKQTRRVK